VSQLGLIRPSSVAFCCPSFWASQVLGGKVLEGLIIINNSLELGSPKSVQPVLEACQKLGKHGLLLIGGDSVWKC